ncbi:MAG: type II toxin-antitoxin system RelE family toxin, partial [Nitrospiraceae bacterium]
FSRRAWRTMQAIDGRSRAYLKQAVLELSVDPLLGKNLKGEFEDLRSYRVGAYRIVYRTTGSLLEMVCLDYRKELFR